MGDKAAARRVADAAGMPIVPGTREPVDLAQAKKQAARIGFPLMVKAAKSLGAGPRQVIFKVVLPSALPTILAGYRLGA